jgi:hypothetical protein
MSILPHTASPRPLLPLHVDNVLQNQNIKKNSSPPFLSPSSMIKNKNNLQFCTDINAKNIIQSYKFSILSINVQSLNKKLWELQNLAKSINNPSVICATETWQPHIPSINIPDYHKPFCLLRGKQKGGGIAIWVKSNLEYTTLPPIPDLKKIEIAGIKLKTGFSETSILAIYRPPNSNLEETVHDLKLILGPLAKNKNNTIIVGDLNIDILKPNNSLSKAYQNLLEEYQLLQLIRSPTRITSHSETAIDHVITNSKTHVTTQVLENSIADHQSILACWQKGTTKQDSYPQVTVKKVNESLTMGNLASTDWPLWWSSVSNKNSDKIFESLHSVITNSIEYKHEIRGKKRLPKQPWMSPKTLALLHKSNIKRRKFHSSRTEIREQNFKEAKKAYRKAIRIDIESYYSSKLKAADKDSKKIWSIINEVLDRGKKSSNDPSITLKYQNKLHTSPTEISNGFNQHFRNMAPNLAKTIKEPPLPYTHFLKQTNKTTNQFSLATVAEDKVTNIINDLKSKNSCGFDNVSNKLLKKISPIIIDPLTKAINASLTEGNFPQILKLAKLQPIFKNGDECLPDNYRPISQLSSFSKILEKISSQQLTEHLDIENIVSDNQFGFRKGHSTLHPLIVTRNELELAKNRNEFSILITLDLKKAFDTVESDQILPEKLKHYGCDFNTKNWFSSFFKNRKQYVSWKHHESEVIDLENISVVQGSALGPQMFNIYINDIAKATNFKTVLFADDTSLIVSGTDLNSVINKANLELCKIADYLAANKLSLNTGKTVYMVFCPSKKTEKSRATKLNLKIGAQEISEVDEVKFLGVTIDNQLKFKTHFQHVTKKVRSGLAALTFTKHILNYTAKLQIYNGLIKPFLEYCPLVWMTKLKSTEMNTLATLQKKCLRLIFNSKYNSHTKTMFKLSNITKISNLIENESISFIHKFTKGMQPKIFNSIIKVHQKETRSSDQQKFPIDKNLIKGDIMYDILHNWNSSSQAAREATSSIQLKSEMAKSNEKKMIKCTKSNCYSCKLGNDLRLANYIKY